MNRPRRHNRSRRGSEGRDEKKSGGYRRHDGFFRRARDQGFAARSVFKLEEIQQRVELLRQGQRLLDLGCAPGSWLQLAAQIVGRGGRVIGVDVDPVEVPLPPWVTVLRGDVAAIEPGQLVAAAGGRFDGLLSDLAPHTSGVRHADQARSLALVERALEIAAAAVADGGFFVAKIFDGGDVPALIARLRLAAREVRTLRPRATRSHSKEIYLVATGWRTSAGMAQIDCRSAQK
ncbi:MAG: RlmE family RNA methyltransferase [Deltaproteobacteria bacterium]|nr:RlmE family RNA methyltransferase [Deltaproteobacteria bacterium]